MLTINQLTKRYGVHTVLDDLTMTLRPGTYGLLAPNGAGKTTLMQLLVTLTHPTSGTISWDGEPIESMGSRYREKIGYLPQSFGYYRNYSPLQFLRYIGTLKGIEQPLLDLEIDDVLEQVALTDVRTKKMKQFSGGMIQRVGIAQALLGKPELLILDEPTAGLDPKERARFRTILTNLSQDTIILLSTHIVSDIESIANQLLLLKDGRLLHEGTTRDICKILDGKLYETICPAEQSNTFREKYIVLSERQEQDGLYVRFVTTSPKEDTWRQIQPMLEDVFLYEYRDHLRGER